MSGEGFEEALERISKYPLANLEEVWLEYDQATDTLYINFSKDEAEETVMTSEGLIIGVSGGRIVSIAITEFKNRVNIP